MSIGVSVLHEDPAVLDDLAYALSRCEGVHVAALGELRGPGVVLASPASLSAAGRYPGGLIVISTGDPLADARAGFAAGASGILRWPDDVASLASAVASATLGSGDETSAGRLISVCPARGGAGATTIACLLAAAVEESLLVDLSGGGQLAFAGEDAGSSLERALASPLPDVVAKLAEEHAAGRALLSRPGDAHVPAEASATLLAAARRISPVVVVDTPAPGRLAGAHATFLVCAADVASLRTARVWLESIPDAHIVLNRVRRGGIRARHVIKALGRAPVAVMPADRRLARASDLGSLPRRPSRSIRTLVRALREEAGV